jgi:hypothetical protein
VKSHLLLFAILFAGQLNPAALPSMSAAGLGGQEISGKTTAAEFIIGEVVNVDREGGTATVKTDRGVIWFMKVEYGAVCLRLPAGEATLNNAAPIRFVEIEVGDRVLGSGLLNEDKKQLRAQRLIIASKVDLEKKRERDLDKWRRRGIDGAVKSINPQTREIDLEVHDTGGSKTVVIVAEKSAFLRYGLGAAGFVDAKPSDLGELKVGDQLKALGERSADGKRFDAELVVSGSFQTIGCIVKETDLLKSEIKAETLDRKETVVITVGKDSILQRIPPQQASALAKAVSIGSPQKMLDGLLSLTFEDLKTGDVTVVVGLVEDDQSRITAIKLLTGVDALLNALKAAPDKRRTITLSAGLPPTVFEFSLWPP